MKNVKLAGETGFANQEAAEELFYISAKCSVGERLCGRASFQLDETGLFDKDVGKQTYICK